MAHARLARSARLSAAALIPSGPSKTKAARFLFPIPQQAQSGDGHSQETKKRCILPSELEREYSGYPKPIAAVI
jgi:hypothetical protein